MTGSIIAQAEPTHLPVTDQTTQAAKTSWDESAQAWIEGVNTDYNRTHLLDPIMLNLAGNVQNKSCLDVGCGEGRFSRMLAARGATVAGIDPVPAHIASASLKHPEGNYLEAFAENLPFPDKSFDLVISYITFVDIHDIRAAIHEISRVLKDGGRFIVANLQSFITTKSDAWAIDGASKHVEVEEYFTERGQRVDFDNGFGKISIINFHRPLETYMQTLMDAGLVMTAFQEPKPTDKAVHDKPCLHLQQLVPYFYTMAWKKIDV